MLPPMSAKTFSRFSRFIRGELGINMTDAKKTMLQARLQKRLRKLGFSTYDDYYDYVFSDEGMRVELLNMIDVVTTNKTDFFREPKHFEYLTETVLPELGRGRAIGSRRDADFWSAGCSTGEEPYTLAMVLSEYKRARPDFRFRIMGSDISTFVLKKAATGIYGHDRVEQVPLALRKRYLLRSKDRSRDTVRICPEIRGLVSFERINFMDGNFGIRESFDVVFCRNVIIYFDRPTQERVLNNICRHLRPEGFIFMGHSETLNGLNVPLKAVTSTVYRKIP